MERIGIWSVNGGLFVLCCFLIASAINLIGGEMLASGPGGVTAPAPAPPAEIRSWEDRQIILTRNLFNASTLLAKPLVPVEEQLEATKLPLRLLGTAASNLPGLSWAAVEDLETRAHYVVHENDPLLDRATVVAIERARIILDNRGRREELALKEELGPTARPSGSTARSTRRRSVGDSTRHRGPVAGSTRNLSERLRELSKSRPQEDREGGGTPARNPAALFSQARILPKYEGGEMIGVQLNNVKPGSLFEKIGIRNGDVIRELNGIRIDSPQQTSEVLRELGEADEFEILVDRPGQAPVTLTYEIED